MERSIDNTNKRYIPAYIISNNGNEMIEKNFINKIYYKKKDDKFYLMINNRLFGEFNDYKCLRKELNNINRFNKNFNIRKELNNRYKVGKTEINDNDIIFDFSRIESEF